MKAFAKWWARWKMRNVDSSDGMTSVYFFRAKYAIMWKFAVTGSWCMKAGDDRVWVFVGGFADGRIKGFKVIVGSLCIWFGRWLDRAYVA